MPKSHSVARCDVAMLRDEEGSAYIQPQQIANALQNHFSSVFSDPNCEEILDPQFNPHHIACHMTDAELDFTTEDVEESIKELKNNSAPGADGIPAVF